MHDKNEPLPTLVISTTDTHITYIELQKQSQNNEIIQFQE